MVAVNKPSQYLKGAESGGHSALYTMGNGAVSLGAKRQGHEADNSPASSP